MLGKGLFENIPLKSKSFPSDGLDRCVEVKLLATDGSVESFVVSMQIWVV